MKKLFFVAMAAVAVSYDNPIVSAIAANLLKPSAISAELDAVFAPSAVIASA